MGIEIDFLPVGDKSKSGDAIAIRYGDLSGANSQPLILTIDGGTKESGEALVDHVQTYYRTKTVNGAFLTHADGDHASGMRVILEKLDVKAVLMHRPWLHSKLVKELLEDGRTTITSIKEKTKENLAVAYEIEKLAIAKGITPVEPFVGLALNHGLSILGPTKEFYEAQLANFDFMPETKEPGAASLVKAIMAGASRAINWLGDRWDTELLFTEPAEDATSPENNSSLVLLLTLDGMHYLFTGDAGVPALRAALDQAAILGIDYSLLRFVQIPHHGSRRNLGPTVLNRLLGLPRAFDKPDRTALVSAAKEGEPKHPSKRVMNAFRRRGVEVHVTAGMIKCHPLPVRAGWIKSTPLPFYSQVEDVDDGQ